MRVALITGSYPPQVCGVGDYAHALAESLRSAGAAVEVVHEHHWSPLHVGSIRRRLLATRADVYHLQYPTTGYGWHLGPQVLALGTPLVVTVHEASQVHVLRKMSLLPLTLRSPLVLFTSEYERRYCCRFAPWIRRRSLVIPIGSNIPVRRGVERISPDTVTCFGLIRPDKGLEDVLFLARMCRERGNGFRFRMIGIPAAGRHGYYARLRSESADLPIEWLMDLHQERLAEELAKTSLAYLPFPDGASERRGSLIALMRNAVAIVTTGGPQTPQAMAEALAIANSPDAALQLLKNLAENAPARTALQQRAYAYSERFAWTSIAGEHLRAYERLSPFRG